jgi:hypothetical protein
MIFHRLASCIGYEASNQSYYLSLDFVDMVIDWVCGDGKEVRIKAKAEQIVCY